MSKKLRNVRWLLCLLAPLFVFAACSKRPAGEKRVKDLTSSDLAAISAGLQTGQIGPSLRLGTGGAQDECDAFIAKLPSDYKYSWFDVPEDWRAPGGRHIQVFFYYKPRAETEVPIVFFNGGPAGDSHSSFDGFATIEAMRDLPFVFIDQRGTGCSSSFPDGPGDDHARLALYGSRAIVKDAEAIRKSVFAGRKWKVFGQSYGAFITHRYATIAPEGVTAAFAHGVALMDDPSQWIANRLLSQERVWRAYLDVYPGDEAMLRAARARISADKCFYNSTSRVCGPEILDSFVMLLGFKTSWSSLHEWLKALATVEDAQFEELTGSIAQAFVFGMLYSHVLAGSAISTLELVPGSANTNVCEEAFGLIRASGKDPLSFAINECRAQLALMRENPEQTQIIKQLGIQPDRLRVTDVSKSLRANPGLKFHLYSGHLDTFCPLEIYDEELAQLGRQITYRSFPDSGHEGFSTEPAVLADLMSTQGLRN